MTATRTLKTREEKILDFIIRSYVRHAEPVASADVRFGLRLKESPATIRSIVAALDEDGFLEQPYTSAGRIPTDQAYRYFVDFLMADDIRRRIARATSDIRSIADALGLLAIAAQGGDTDSYGLSYLLSQPEFREPHAVRRVAHFVDHAEDMFDAYRGIPERRVFIGRENPVREATDCSVFYISEGRGDGRHEVLLVGPTRVNYEKISALINEFFNLHDR